MIDTNREDRAAYIAGLRAYADWLDTHPEVPTSVIGTHYYRFETGIYASTVDDPRAVLAAVARALPGRRQKKVDNDRYFSVEAAFDGFHVRFSTLRANVCERVQVGVRQVERVDPEAPKVTVEEPVYEYRCDGSLLAALDNGEAVAS